MTIVLLWVGTSACVALVAGVVGWAAGITRAPAAADDEIRALRISVQNITNIAGRARGERDHWMCRALAAERGIQEDLAILEQVWEDS